MRYQTFSDPLPGPVGLTKGQFSDHGYWTISIDREEVTGTLRSNEATATRTSLKKGICVLSVFYRNYSYPLTLSNVGGPSWSWMLRDHIQVQKEKQNFVVGCLRTP